MINSVELVLMFLSMFPSLNPDNIEAVGFLLGLSCQYDMLDLMFMIVNYGIGRLAMNHIDTLLALAQCNGHNIEGLDKRDMTDKDIYEILYSIVNPFLAQLEPSEMALLRQTQCGGEGVLRLPLIDLEILVKNWVRNVRQDDEKRDRFGKLAEAARANSISNILKAAGAPKSGNLAPPFDNRTVQEKTDAWSKIKLNHKTAAAIVNYCDNKYAAAPMDAKLTRTRRVEKQKQRQDLESITTDSSGVCIGFTLSMRTITHVRPRKSNHDRSSRTSGLWEDHQTTSRDGNPDLSWTTESGSTRESSESDDPRDLPQSMSISTWEAKWQHILNQPSLVGYYMRWEMHVTKHGMPRRAPATPAVVPKSPIPGMTMEQVYESYADRWDVEQNQLWRDALAGHTKTDLDNEFVDSGIERQTKDEEKAGTKRGAMAKAIKGVCLGIRGLFKSRGSAL
ncbi:hypothetical protein RhiJN_27742 [Ceratobasidium sp. AG-Ba]|nr:hypothetical protein RhiJN_27742 [Ceratobasidium sp. AG-Ba]